MLISRLFNIKKMRKIETPPVPKFSLEERRDKLGTIHIPNIRALRTLDKFKL